MQRIAILRGGGGRRRGGRIKNDWREMFCAHIGADFIFATRDKKKLSGYLPLTFHPAINFFLSRDIVPLFFPLLPSTSALLFPFLTNTDTHTDPFIKSRERPRNLYRFVSRCVHDVPFVLLWNSRCPPRITWRDRDG